MTYSFSKPTFVLNSTVRQVTSSLTISPASAVMPLSDNYTILIQAMDGHGYAVYAPIRAHAHCQVCVGNQNWLQYGELHECEFGVCVQRLDYALYMDSRSNHSRISRAALDSTRAATGTEQTDYSINSKRASFYWLIDQSGGAPAILDNAKSYANLGALYSCP